MFFFAVVFFVATALANDDIDVQVGLKVPKIIHQTWKTNTPPEKWKIAQESWPRLHPDWEYHLWSDAENENFIREKFSWFLPTFIGYRFPIERADAIRYFLLYYYGGLYVDLDMEAVKPFDDLIENKTVALTRSANTGKFTNNLMISRKGEPYWKFVHTELAARANITGYITHEVEILETTGPRLMQSAAAMWEASGGRPLVEGIDSRLVHPCGRCEPVPCTKPGAYIRLWEGNSWHDTISSVGMFFDCQGLNFGIVTAALAIAIFVAISEIKKRELVEMKEYSPREWQYWCRCLATPSRRYTSHVDDFDEEDEFMDL